MTPEPFDIEAIKARLNHYKACHDHAPSDIISHAKEDIDALIRRVEELEKELKEKRKPDLSFMDEALNSGDGSYKP